MSNVRDLENSREEANTTSNSSNEENVRFEDKFTSVPYSAFSPVQKRIIVFTVTAAGFFGPLSGGIYLPSLPTMEKEFKVSTNSMNLTVSLFMLTFAFAPLLWSSHADYFGRKLLYTISFALFIVINIVLAVIPPSFPALLILRIAQAFAASSVMSLGAGSIADITEPKDRPSVLSYFMLGPQLGPLLGPVIGGALNSVTWRWMFGYLAIAATPVWLLFVFVLPETLRCRVGNGRCASERKLFDWPSFYVMAPEKERGPPPPKPSLMTFAGLLRIPSIALLSVNNALIFGAFYCIQVTLPKVLSEQYGFSSSKIGAAFLAPGGAMIVGSLICGRLSKIYRARISGQANASEKQLSFQHFGIIISISGVLMYGWFIQSSGPLAAVLVSCALAGFGMTWSFLLTTSYLTELSPMQVAATVALASLLRNPAAAIGSVVVNPVVERIGMGWTFTGIAATQVVGALLAAIVLVKGGEWMQRRTELPVKK